MDVKCVDSSVSELIVVETRGVELMSEFVADVGWVVWVVKSLVKSVDETLWLVDENDGSEGSVILLVSLLKENDDDGSDELISTVVWNVEDAELVECTLASVPVDADDASVDVDSNEVLEKSSVEESDVDRESVVLSWTVVDDETSVCADDEVVSKLLDSEVIAELGALIVVESETWVDLNVEIEVDSSFWVL